MGAQSSNAKTETNIVNKAVTNILMESSQNCSATVSTSQTVSISDIKTIGCRLNVGGVSQEATISQNFSCAQDSSQNADMQAKLKTQLEASSEAATKGVTVGSNSSNAETISNLTNDVLNNVNVSNIASCVAEAVAKQEAGIARIEADCRGMERGDNIVNVGNIAQLITLAQVSKCTQGNVQASKAITEFENAIKASSSAKTSGIEPSAISAGVTICIVISILMALSFMLM
jgi:hypothetical protein